MFETKVPNSRLVVRQIETSPSAGGSLHTHTHTHSCSRETSVDVHIWIAASYKSWSSPLKRSIINFSNLTRSEKLISTAKAQVTVSCSANGVGRFGHLERILPEWWCRRQPWILQYLYLVRAHGSNVFVRSKWNEITLTALFRCNDVDKPSTFR